MPIGYLETVGSVALFTLAVLFPPRRPTILAPVIQMVTHLVNEAPIIGWAWLVFATVTAAVDGELASTGGLLVAAFAALTAGGLVVVAVRGLRARATIENAFRLAHWPSVTAPTMPSGKLQIARRLLLARRLRSILLPLPIRPRSVRRVRNVRYGPHGRYNLADLYMTRDRAGEAMPVLVHLHGGHFDIGAKNREARSLLYRFSQAGWLSISANYRLRQAGSFPNSQIDVKRLIAWVRSSGALYGADPKHIVVAGSSAGAHLTALAALTPNDPRFQPGFELADTSIQGAVCLYGYLGEREAAPMPSSPLAYIRADAPPFLIFVAGNDRLLHPEPADAFVHALNDVSENPVLNVRLAGAMHSFDLLPSPRFDAVIDATERFANQVLRSRRASVARPDERDHRSRRRRVDDA